MNTKLCSCLLVAALLLSSNLFGQKKNVYTKFNALSRPEKVWVFLHPFVSRTAYLISNKTIEAVKNLKLKNTIGQDEAGGELDAFKHTFWMALLSQKINSEKARKLGIAHEKGNYQGFKKRKLEDNSCSDKASCEMDLWNNNIGIEIGCTNKTANIAELETLVIQALVNGNLLIIKKDSLGNYLNAQGAIIKTESFCKSWDNEKCLIKSKQSAKTIH